MKPWMYLALLIGLIGSLHVMMLPSAELKPTEYEVELNNMLATCVKNANDLRQCQPIKNVISKARRVK